MEIEEVIKTFKLCGNYHPGHEITEEECKAMTSAIDYLKDYQNIQRLLKDFFGLLNRGDASDYVEE